VTKRPHGIQRYQTDRCRCFTCRIAKAEYRRRCEAGQVGGYTDAAPVREHLLALRAAGYGTRRLMSVTGVSRPTLRRLAASPATVHSKVAAALLAIPVGPPPPPRRYVPSLGTHRRLQALAALGWSFAQQAERVGMPQSQLLRTLSNPTLEPVNADRIRALYDDLSMRVPEPTVWVARIQERSRLHRYFPPLAWDDERLDDPEALPCLLPPVEPVDRDLELLVQHLVAGHPVEPTVDAIREVIRRMPDAKNREIAKAIGRSPQWISDIRQRMKAAA
jgi:hypothetical protein